MTSINLDALQPDDAFLSDLGKNVWLMDNHRWACLVWERHRSANRYCLIHADFHWDAVDDFRDNETQKVALLSADISGIERFVVENNWIQYDSFIAPAVRRGLFKEVHFLCTEDDNDIGLDEDLLLASGTTQFIHDTVESLVNHNIQTPLIFDLCLDLFNKADNWETGDLWSDSEIESFLESVAPLVRAAEVVTVSLSFGYSGTEADTRHLAKIVLPRLLGTRSDA
jgi:hypothetical protein